MGGVFGISFFVRQEAYITALICSSALFESLKNGETNPHHCLFMVCRENDGFFSVLDLPLAGQDLEFFSVMIH